MYGDFGELADSAGAYFSAGFVRGDVGIIVARAENIAAVRERLDAAGWDAKRLDGLLLTADAEETLSRFMEDDRPVRARFVETIGRLLDEAEQRRPGANVRAFGEMVDLLWERDEKDAAIELERLWNELAAERGFSLLCGYRFDVFDEESLRDRLPGLIEAHSHVRPVAKPGLMGRAVDSALKDEVSDPEAARIYLAAGDGPERKVPLAQAVLTWLSRNEPKLAGRVLPASRDGYRRATRSVG